MNLQVYKPLFYFELMSSETYKLKNSKKGAGSYVISMR